MADVVTGPTQLDPTKQDLIASFVLKELQGQSTFINTINDVSNMVGPGMKQVAVPNLASFTASDLACPTPGDASTAASATDDILVLDKHGYVAWLVCDDSEFQSNINVQQEYLKRATSALARHIDDTIISILDTDASASSPVVGASSYDRFLAGRRTLLENFANPEDIVYYISPETEELLNKEAEFQRIVGGFDPNSPINTGLIGRPYGIPVVMSTRLSGDVGYMFTRDSVAIGFQKAVRFSRQLKNEYGVDSYRYAGQVDYGAESMYKGQLGEAATASPYILKIAA